MFLNPVKSSLTCHCWQELSSSLHDEPYEFVNIFGFSECARCGCDFFKCTSLSCTQRAALLRRLSSNVVVICVRLAKQIN